MNTSNPYWTTRRKQTCDKKTIECGFNNKYICNKRNMGSNENERSYNDLVQWILKTQNSGPFIWMLYMRIAVIKIERNATDFILKNREDYTKVTDDFLDTLLLAFESILSMKKMFKEAKIWRYQEIILKPFKIENHSHYFDIGLIKPKPWGSKNDAAMLSFALNELRIFDGFEPEDITDEVVARCRHFCVGGDEHSMEFIRNKLLTLTILYSILLIAVFSTQNHKT